MVRILQGNYKGETGLITMIYNDVQTVKCKEDEKKLINPNPIVKLDKT